MRRRAVLWLAIAAAQLAAAPAALAVSDRDLAHLSTTQASGSGVHGVSFGVGGGLGRAVLGLVLVVGAILVVSRLLKASQKRRFGLGGGPSSALEVLSTTPLGPNRNLHLLRIGQEVLLIGAAEGGISRLRTFDPAEAIDLGMLPPDGGEGFGEPTTGATAPAPSRALPASSARPARKRGLLDTLRHLSAR
jgi:flagellar protein FliO/FliZ